MTYYEEAVVKKYKRENYKDSTQLNLGVNSKFKKNTRVIVIKRDDFKNINDSVENFKKGFMKTLEENSQTIVDKNRLEDLSDENSQLKKSNEILSGDNEKLIKLNNELSEENSKLKNKIIKLQDDHKLELKVESDKVEKLLITIATNEKSLKDKDLLLTSKENMISSYEKDIEDKDNKINDYENEISGYKDTIEDKENIISDYKKDIEDKDNKIETLTHNWRWYKRIFNILPKGINENKPDGK